MRFQPTIQRNRCVRSSILFTTVGIRKHRSEWRINAALPSSVVDQPDHCNV
jgi:hypothetical protein